MKIHLSTFAGIVLFAFGASAQITPKSYAIGGGFNLAYGQVGSVPNEINQFNFSISPSFGKFISEKWLLEGGVGYGFSSFRNNGLSSYNRTYSNSFSLSFGATRFIPITDRFYFTLGGFVSPVYTHTTNESGGVAYSKSSYSTTSASISVTPGLSYFINEKWMLYSNFGAAKFTMSSGSNTSDINYNFGMNLNSTSYLFGLRYVFAGVK